MAKVEIYTSPFCGFCFRAKDLLKKKGAAFEEIDVAMDAGQKQVMVQRAGGRTSVPQIFIDGEHVGGCDDLFALEASGRLGPKLSAGAAK